MSVPRYESYRDSGSDWIGEVPANWEVAPLKAAFSVVGGATPKSDVADYWDGGIPWVTPGDLSRLETPFLSDTIRTISEDGLASCAATRVPAGSVILSTRAPIGSLGITTEPSTTNQGCKALVPRHDADPQFLAYTLSVATTALNVRGKGTTFLELSGDELARFKVPFPSTTEQAAIAAFLDSETGKIDALVEAHRQLIELLKQKRQAVISHAVAKGLDPTVPMKDSGVEWLGDMPANWQLMALARLVDDRRPITYGIVQPGPSDPGGRFMVRGQDYSTSWADPRAIFRVSPTVEEPYRRARLRAGDLVITIVGAGVGNVAVVPDFLDGANITQTTARIATDTDLVDPRYLEFCLRSDLGRTQVSLFQKGAAQPGLNLEHLKAFRVTLPPREEQEAIILHVERELRGLEPLIKIAESAVLLLRERRSALISAAVTGKIDVRSLAPTQAEAA